MELSLSIHPTIVLMRLFSVFLAMTVCALFSIIFVGTCDGKLDWDGKISSGGRSFRGILKDQTTNKDKLESIVRQQNLLPPLLYDEDLPVDDTEAKWQSLNQDMEFIPANGVDHHSVHRFLEQGNYNNDVEESYGGLAGMEGIYNAEPFAYGVDEYDEYQQAWRLMGFIVDCNPMVDDDYYQNDGSGSGDHGTEDGCARYVLWAAVSPRSSFWNGIRFWGQ